ncbi:MAG: DUF4276 family protein [Pseudomonadota bacterium]
MVQVIVFAEGQTEEKFIKQLVAPALRHLDVFIKPQLLSTSQTSRGGAITFDRLKLNARNTLRQHPDAVLSTFLDLYALARDFPAFEDARKKPDVYSRVAHLEQALNDAIVAHVGCRPKRFLPHIQPYEFEGLLFSDVKALSAVEPSWASNLADLTRIRTSVQTPEHINDGYQTAPSRRLEGLLHPKYKKTTHGPRAAAHITLEVIERECKHFKSWMDSLRGLASPEKY